MKNNITLILMIFASAAVAQLKYKPLIGENKYWIYSQNDDWEPAPRSIGGFLVSFGSDTIISGVKYTKLLRNSLNGYNPCSSGPCFVAYFPYQVDPVNAITIAYLREDSVARKVYSLPAIQFHKYCESVEHVLYDFDQKVGDTLAICNRRIHSAGDSERLIMIDSIKTEELYGKQRRVWYFEGLRYGGLPYFTTSRLIEGIGLDRNMGFYADFTDNFGDYCEGSLAECNIISSTNDLSSSIDKFIIVYPNPVTDVLSLRGDVDWSLAEVYNAGGQLLLSSHEAEINVSGLLSGIYFIKIITLQNDYVYRKFVKD